MKISIFLAILLIFGFTFGTRFAILKPWPVPDKNTKIVNPIKSTPTSINEGKVLWDMHCKSCHGKSGKGDGVKAVQLKTDPGNFTTVDFKKQSDGSLFFKISEGRDGMPSFKKKLPESDDIWNIINYIKTLK